MGGGNFFLLNLQIVKISDKHKKFSQEENDEEKIMKMEIKVDNVVDVVGFKKVKNYIFHQKIFKFNFLKNF